MILPSTTAVACGTLSGFLARSVTPVVPIVTARPPTSQITVNTLLQVDDGSSSNTWENSHTCGWYAGTLSSAFSCGSPLVCATNTNNIVACTWVDTPGDFFTTCMNKDDCHDGKCSSNTSKAVYCGDGGINTKCVRYLWTSSPIRSRFTCSTVDTTITLLDEPFYVAAKSTSSSTTSDSSTTHEPTPTPVPSTSSTTNSENSSSPSPSPTSSAKDSSTSSKVKSAPTSGKATSSSNTAKPSTVGSTATGDDASTSEISLSRSDSSSIPVVTSTGTIITTLPPPASTSGTGTASATPTPAVGVPPTAPSDTSGLSTGAKAGIGIGAAAGLLLLLLAVALILFKKRQARDEPAQHNTWPMYDRPAPSTSQPSVRPVLPGRSASQQSRGFWHRGQRAGDEDGDPYDAGVGGSEIPVDMRGQGAVVGGAVELDGVAVGGLAHSASRPMAAVSQRAPPAWQELQNHHATTAGPSSQQPWQQDQRNSRIATVSQPGWQGQSYPRASTSQHSLYGQRPRPQRYSTVSEAQEWDVQDNRPWSDH